MMRKPLVSVLIATRNSEKYLSRCLASVANQTYGNIEIVLVDNTATIDKTRLIAKKFTDKVYQYGPERSSQYNYAAKKAKGKYIYRIDSDFLLDKDIVEQCVARCEHFGFDGVAPHNTSDDSLGYWSQVRKLERDCYIDDTLIVGLRFMKKKIFIALGGFDERMYAGEDYDLHNRFIQAGYSWTRVKAKEVHLGEVTSIFDFIKKSYYYGRNLTVYMDKYPKRGGSQMIPLRLAYLRHIDKLVRKPFITLGLILMTFLKFGAGGIGFILDKVKTVDRTNLKQLLSTLMYS